MSTEDKKAMDQAMAILRERFWAVQIVAVRKDDDVVCCHGSGSYHARMGAVRDWVLHNEEVTREGARIRRQEGAKP